MTLDINEYDVIGCLQRAGLQYQVKERYIVTQCPKHEERNPSCQIFKDDWFCACLAGCGRFPITDAFPELRNNTGGTYSPLERRPKIETQPTYKTFDLMEEWSRLPLIPRTHTFKGIPLEVLDELGWRWDEGKNSYFIPYFDHSRTKVPFAQWRHLAGERRFTFLAGAKPTLYGKWLIKPGARLFICEGTSDAATLSWCGVPAVALPSASSGKLLQAFATHVVGIGCTLVYSGDNDAAGQALRDSLNEAGVAYRVCQPPEKYKDWGEFFEAEGQAAVGDWCFPKLHE